MELNHFYKKKEREGGVLDKLAFEELLLLFFFFNFVFFF